MSDPAPYLVERVREQLAEDPRVGELGIEVAVVSGTVYVTGAVASPQQREQVARVVGELAPGLEVRNDVTVVTPAAPGEPGTAPEVLG